VIATLDPTSLLRLVGLGAASGTRGALALLALGIAARFDSGTLHGQWATLAHPAVLGALAALALFEAWAERDDDLQDLAALATAGARAASGSVAAMASLDHLPPLAAGAAGLGLALGTDFLRRRVHGLLKLARTEVTDPRRWLTWLENGGVPGVVAAAILAPFLAGVLVAAAALGGLLVALAARRIEAAWRRPCPFCSKPIRVEATLCPACRRELPVAKEPGLRLGTAGRRAG
jgi:hypothetical protein